jgi:hypothetical protein
VTRIPRGPWMRPGSIPLAVLGKLGAARRLEAAVRVAELGVLDVQGR